jgi:hypothetical protein
MIGAKLRFGGAAAEAWLSSFPRMRESRACPGLDPGAIVVSLALDPRFRGGDEEKSELKGGGLLEGNGQST